MQWDDAFGLGLLYMHARHYSPALGRFLQPDPDGSESNLYAYTANNPVTELDPDGTCFILCVVIVGIILFGGMGATAEVVTYAATTPEEQWSAEDARGSAFNGFVKGASLVPIPAGRGVGLLARALSKVPKAARAADKVRASLLRSAAHRNILPDGVQRFGQHSLERMEEHAVTRRMVDVTIRRGERYWDPLNLSVPHILRGRMESGKDLLVGRNPITGKITTVLPGRKLVRPRLERLR